MISQEEKRKKAIERIRSKSSSDLELLITRSNKYMYAQLIHQKITIFSASTKNILLEKDGSKSALNTDSCAALGEFMAQKFLDNNKYPKIPYLNRANYKYGKRISSFYSSFVAALNYDK